MSAPALVPALEGPDLRDEAGVHLQATLAELLALTLVGKQLHWSVQGPHFLPVHRQLDELVEDWHRLADEVAERAAALGVWPDGQLGAIAAAGAAEVAPGPVDDHAALHEVASRLAAVAELSRARMDRLGEFDAVSQDVLVGVVRTLEEQLWMVRAQG
jgi:starvation-inducible DNA-binding protein